MKKLKAISQKITFSHGTGKRTSIGHSPNTRPKNKNSRKQYKKYRGQGFP